MRPVYPWATALRWGAAGAVVIAVVVDVGSGRVVESALIGVLLGAVLTVIIRYGGGEGSD